MKANKLLMVLLSVFSIYSCQIEEAYHFNKDFSGHTNLSIDMKQYLAILPDTTNKRQELLDTLDLKLKEGIININAIKGISNSKVAWNEDSTAFTVTYDFKSMKVLNQAKQLSGDITDKSKNEENSDLTKKKSFGEFIKKGNKTVIYRFNDPTAQDSSSINTDQFEKMFKFTLSFHFERPILSVQHSKAQFLKEQNKVTINQADLRGDENEIVFKLK